MPWQNSLAQNGNKDVKYNFNGASRAGTKEFSVDYSETTAGMEGGRLAAGIDGVPRTAPEII